MDYANIVPAAWQASAETSTQKSEALGLDFLSTLKVAERVEVTIPFPVILKWDNVKKDGKITEVKKIRFFTSDLANASFEVSPVFEPGYVVDAIHIGAHTLIMCKISVNITLGLFLRHMNIIRQRKSRKGKTTNNTQGNSHKDNS